MLNHITEFLKDKVIFIIFLAVMYVAVATTTFAYRHPWATDIERFLYIKEALMFKKVSYKEMREHYE